MSFLGACDLKEKIEAFSEDPPVSPISETIKSSAIIGFASVVSHAHYRGCDLPFASVGSSNQTKIIQIDLGNNFPFRFQNDLYKDITILSIKLDDDMYILSVLLGDSEILTGEFRLYKIHTFPVLIKEGKVMAVFASQDINFGPDHYLEISLSAEEVQFEIERLESSFPTDEYVAIAQNAWFVQVDPNNSLDDFADDSYLLSGGQQNVAVTTDCEIPDASVVQMAIVNTTFSPFCSKNPETGFVVMQNIEMESKSGITLGQAFFDFIPDCDGKIKLVLGTGSFIGASGKKIKLGL